MTVSRPGRHLIEDPSPILIVDDSAVARLTLRTIIEQDPAFRVTTAGDPYDAVEVMRKVVPSAIVLDIDMPRMDGLTFLRKLMRQHPLPVLLCTDHPERGLTGLEYGALEVIPKPRWDDPAVLESWGDRLRDSLRLAIAARPSPTTVAPPTPTTSPVTEPKRNTDAILPRARYQDRGLTHDRLIVIGASTGGVQAIARLLAGFRGNLPGAVIVQHMPGGFTAAFANRLAQDPKIAPAVYEAAHGSPIQPGTVLIAPGDFHGLVRRVGTGFRLELADGPPVNRHKPSVDVLFRSAAQAAGPRVLAVLLTGMGDDGAQGMVELAEDGSWTIAQDEASSVVFGMPAAAIRRGAVRQVLPLDRIANAIAIWTDGPV